MRVSGNETEDRLTALEVNKLNAATTVGSPSTAEAFEELKEQHDAEMAHLGNRIQNVIESAAEARADVAADAADARAEMHSDLEAHLASSEEEREGLRADLVALGDRVGAMQAEFGKLQGLEGEVERLRAASLEAARQAAEVQAAPSAEPEANLEWKQNIEGAVKGEIHTQP